MLKNDNGLRVHDVLVHMGWIAGVQANALAYWTMRLADELEGVGRHIVPYRALRELAWNNIRPFDTKTYAVTEGYPRDVRRFMDRNAHRFPSKYDQCLREIQKALNDIHGVSGITGRETLSIAA